MRQVAWQEIDRVAVKAVTMHKTRAVRLKVCTMTRRIGNPISLERFFKIHQCDSGDMRLHSRFFTFASVDRFRAHLMAARGLLTPTGVESETRAQVRIFDYCGFIYALWHVRWLMHLKVSPRAV